MEKIKNMPKWLLIVLIVLAIGVVGSALSSNNTSSDGGTNETQNKAEEKRKEPTYKVNEPFSFDDLEITIGNEVSYTTIKNEFSEHNKKTVVKVPITVKNNKDESHRLNMFNIKYFGPQGVELDGISTYFDEDNCIEFAGELMPGASYKKYMFFLYDGNGTYTIQFDNYAQKINFKLNIKK